MEVAVLLEVFSGGSLLFLGVMFLKTIKLDVPKKWVF